MSRIVRVAAALAFVMTACDAPARTSPGGQGKRPVAELAVVVREGDEQRTGTITCTSKNVGTGFLHGVMPAGSACATALTSIPVAGFLEHGKLPKPPKCTRASPRREGASVRITGRIQRREIDRTLTVDSDCEATMWNLMLPLVETSREPLVEGHEW